MQTMKLWDGRSVPRIGIGTWAAGGAARWGDALTIYGEVDDVRSEAALAMAYEHGRAGVRHGCRLWRRQCRADPRPGAEGQGRCRHRHQGRLFRRSRDPPDRTDGCLARGGPRIDRQFAQAPAARPHRHRAAAYQRVSGRARPRQVFDTLAPAAQRGQDRRLRLEHRPPERLSAYASREGFVAVENDFNVFTPASESDGHRRARKTGLAEPAAAGNGPAHRQIHAGHKASRQRRARRQCRMDGVLQGWRRQPAISRKARRDPRTC